MKRFLIISGLFLLQYKGYAQNKLNLEPFALTYGSTVKYAGGGGLMVNYELIPNWWVAGGASFVRDNASNDLPVGMDASPDYFNITKFELRISRKFDLSESIQVIPFFSGDFNNYALDGGDYNTKTLSAGVLFEYAFTNRFGLFAGLKFFDLTDATNDDIIGLRTSPFVSADRMYDRWPMDLIIGLSVNVFQKKEL